MESQKPKIELYVKRPFGEKMNASFEFIKENWKPLLKFTTYLTLPLCLVQALSLNGFMGGYMSMTMNMTGTDTSELLEQLPMLGATYAVTLICMLVGVIMLGSLIYALMQTYNQREERLEGITLTELKPLLFSNMARMLKLTMFCVVVSLLAILVISLVTALTPFTLLLTLPLAIACVIPLALFTPIYMFENISLTQAFKKTFHLGFATWGGTFLIMMVMGIFANIIQSIVGAPWTIAFVVKALFDSGELAGGEMVHTIGFSFFIYLTGVLMSFGIYLSSIFALIGMVYQYGHASEVVDHISVESDIDNFDKL